MHKRQRTLFVIALAGTLFLCSGCASSPSKLTTDAVAQIAPDVPAIAPETQRKAADEIEGGQCPALSDVADACLITRDESRALKGEKLPQ